MSTMKEKRDRSSLVLAMYSDEVSGPEQKDKMMDLLTDLHILADHEEIDINTIYDLAAECAMEEIGEDHTP